MNTADLRERITRCKDFSAEERDYVLDTLAVGDYRGRHDYPSKHGPGSDPWTTLAWAILDQLPPNAMKRHHRFLLGGMIASAFKETAIAAAHTAKHGTAHVIEAVDAPGLGFRIDHIWAALVIDDNGEGVCAAPMDTGAGMITAPLIAADPQRLDVIKKMAQEIATYFKKPVRIAKFTKRENLELLQP
jgi:hypothetical protein